MPLPSAVATSGVNAFGSIIAQAIPSAPAVIALLNAVTICGTLLVSEPVQVYEHPSRLHASAMP